jgi:hypothetical protein
LSFLNELKKDKQGLEECLNKIRTEYIVNTMSKQPIEWQYPLPWSFSTALGNACKPLSQNNPTSSQAKGEQQFDNIREDERIIEYRAREIEILDKSGSMVKKTDYLITCVQGPVSDHNNLPTNIKIGDVIKIGKNLITANIIIATYAKDSELTP